jgi:hypothetical protein
VRVLEPGREADLALEPLGGQPRRELGGEHLDHHAAAEARVLGQEHPRHPPTPELALERVRAAQCRPKPRAQPRRALRVQTAPPQVTAGPKIGLPARRR